MAELLDAQIPDALNAALTASGSKLTFSRGVPQSTFVEPVVLDDEPPRQETAEPAPAAPAQPAHQPWEEPLSTVQTQLQHFATKDDMQAMADRLARQQAEQQAALLAALRAEPAPAKPAAPAAPQPVRLTDATRKAYLDGDFTDLEAWERSQQEVQQQQRAREQAQQREDETRAAQQTMITNLAANYRFLNEDEGWTAMVQEYARVAQDPLTPLTMPPDPRYLVELGGKQFDLRIATVAARTVKAQRDLQAQQATAAADAAKGAAPAAQGGAQQQQRPRQAPTYVLPATMVQGNDPLLGRADVQQALERAGWGKTPATQAKKVAERLPQRLRDQLAAMHRQGRSHEVGTA